MVKLLQNKVAESRLALPVTALYAVMIWLLCGVIQQSLWIQLGCFAVTSYLMVELNNKNALIRIYSRMVSCSFLVLSCCACFLFPSLRETLAMVCVVAFYLIVFASYQDKSSTGICYYAFLFIGLASMAYVHILYFVPFLWLLMATNLLCFSWRTWSASLLGLLTPYWFGVCWLCYQEDLTSLFNHFLALGEFPFRYETLSVQQIVTFVFIVILAGIGIVHYIRKSFQDKIRIRMFFGIFVWMDVLATVFLVLQPQHYDVLLRMMIVNTAPLIAHYLSLTSTKLTNVVFIVITAMAILLTAFNVWSISFLS